MTVVCQVVSFPVNREEIDRINGGPCLFALVCYQRGTRDYTTCGWTTDAGRTARDRGTKKRQQQRPGFCEIESMVYPKRGLPDHLLAGNFLELLGDVEGCTYHFHPHRPSQRCRRRQMVTYVQRRNAGNVQKVR